MRLFFHELPRRLGTTTASSVALLVAAASVAAASESEFGDVVVPFVENYCYDCHNDFEANGGFDAGAYGDAAAMQADYDVWEKVAQVLEYGQMPPEDADQPDGDERLAVGNWIRTELDQFDCSGETFVGRVTLRRLNRTEYDNTIRDLTGLDLNLSANFPSDDVGYGFDNMGDVLSTSPLLLEKYLDAAEQVALRAIETEPPQQNVYLQRDYRRLRSTIDDSLDRDIRAHVLKDVAEVHTETDFDETGRYVLAVKAYQFAAEEEDAVMELLIDGEPVAEFEVSAERGAPELYRTPPLRMEAGEHRIAAAFRNPSPPPEPEEADQEENDDEDDDSERRRRRNRRRGDGRRTLLIERFEIQGPLEQEHALRSDSHRRIIPEPPRRDAPLDDLRDVLARFTRRAFRRPVEEAELQPLVALAAGVIDEGGSFEEAVQLGVQAVLSSPSFLFRVERDPDPAVGGPVRRLSEHELAVRLSYFLWSSMPDEELFRLAEEGRLREALDAQVRRMLQDPKSRALVENFGGQWLTLRNLAEFDPSPELFPDFDEALRAAMLEETYSLFEYIVREDRSVFEFLTADYTFLNERLARHYGVPGVAGDRLRRVVLADVPRGGVLTQGSILALTSNPTRTSPVKRGKWVLEQLLGTPPPPPPPDVDELPEGGEALQGTLREQMELHRDSPMCASCHARMDPIGFGLENFDATGAWRDEEAGHAVDASGRLPGGSAFRGPSELRDALADDADQFRRTLAKKLATYALGRGLDKRDRCTLRYITTLMREQDDRFSSLVLAIVHSDPFQMRGGIDDAPERP